MAEVNPFAPESVRTVVGSVIDKEIADVEVLMVTEDQPLVSRAIVPQVLADPEVLIRPRSRISPGCSRQDVGVEVLGEHGEGLDGPRRRIHEREDPRHFIKPVTLVLASYGRVQALDSAGKVDKYVVHVDVEDLLHATRETDM